MAKLRRDIEERIIREEIMRMLHMRIRVIFSCCEYQINAFIQQLISIYMYLIL